MSFAVGKRMMAKFQSWVEPSDNVSIPAERRRARLLSGLLIFTVAMVFLSVFSSRTAVALITLVFIVGAYVLSRTRYYQWGALLAVITLMLPSFVAVFTLPSAQLADPASIVIPLSWLLVALIFSSLWLQVWLTTLLIGTTIALVLALPFTRPQTNMVGVQQTVWLFVASGGLLVLAGVVRKRDLEEIETQTQALEDQKQIIQMSAQRYRELVESISDIVYRVDVKGRFTYVSASAALLTGYAERQLIGMHFTDLVDPASRRMLRDFYINQMKQRNLESLIAFPIIRLDGTLRWVEQKTTLTFADDNTISGFQGVVRDITERKRSEEKLEALYSVMAQPNLTIDEQLSKAVKIGTEILGLDLGIISQIENNAYTVLYGYSKDGSLQAGQMFDFEKTYCELAYQANDLISIDHMGDSVYKGHPCYSLFGLEAYVGIPLSVNGLRFGTLNFSSATPRKQALNTAERDFFLLMAQWISTMLERKFAQERLKKSETNLRSILDNSPAIIMRIDPQYRIEFIRDPAYDAQTLEMLIGQSIFSLIPPQYTETVKDALEQLFQAQHHAQYETKAVTPTSNAEVSYLTNAAPIVTDGQVVGALLVSNDITERKQVEHQIQMQNESLVKANREIAIARKQAEAANKLKSQFLATMSHELRTPLNAVIGYTQLQLAGMAGDLSEEQYNFQERILANAQHLLQLINEVLDLSKIEAGRLELAEKPFNLADMLEEVVRQNQVLAEAKGLTFEQHIDERLPSMVIGDRGRIKQIIINLVSNAIKFTDKGSVLVETTLYNKENWRITVTDTGMGISSTMQETVFDEFRQAENGIERGGTGLGLAIVRKLVLMMGGNIRLSSELGHGSTFIVTLPLITEVQPASEVIEI